MKGSVLGIVYFPPNAGGLGATRYTYHTSRQGGSEDGPWASDTVSYTYQHRLCTGMAIQQPGGTHVVTVPRTPASQFIRLRKDGPSLP
jgi:hypothetical protein